MPTKKKFKKFPKIGPTVVKKASAKKVKKNAEKLLKAIKTKVKPKKAAKKETRVSAPKNVWTEERVQALYDLPANTPSISRLPNGLGSTHPGEPHEWEWEKEPLMAPVCLGCNCTGDLVEEDYGDSYERDYDRDEDLFDDGFGDDILGERYW